MTDYISRADALEQMAQAECGLHYDDCEADNCSCSYIKRILDIPSADSVQGWIPLSHDDDGMGTDFPYERDGEWVIVTDGKTISVERIKKDAYDHFFPDGRWFELEDVIAWMPLPTP